MVAQKKKKKKTANINAGVAGTCAHWTPEQRGLALAICRPPDTYATHIPEAIGIASGLGMKKIKKQPTP